MPPKTPQEENKDTRLEAILSLLEQAPTRKEFVEAFGEVVKVVTANKKENTQFVEELSKTLQQVLKKIQDDHSSSLSELKAQVNDLFVTEQLQRLSDNLTTKIEEKLATLRNGDDGHTPTKQELVALITPLIPPPKPSKNGSPDTPAKIRDKLESLKGEDRLDTSAIKGLEKRLKKLETSQSFSTGGSGGNVVRAYDLSASLDGVLKTFALPAFWRVISVHLSSFPNILRPTVDYTTDNSAFTITFTSEINAGTGLASGQTCIITYATTV